MTERTVRLPLGDSPVSARLLYGADVVETLKSLPDGSVNCCVTSPPYWSQRSYLSEDDPQKKYEIGQEPTPQEFAASMVRVFTEVRRVLRKDGVFWLNLGDTYAAERGGSAFPAETMAGGVRGKGDGDSLRGRGQNYQPHREASKIGLKHKDMVLIPHLTAAALRDSGWYLRAACPWIKRNCFPSRSGDKPASALEYLFLFSKAENYEYDMDSVRGLTGRNQRNTDAFFDSIRRILAGDDVLLSNEDGLPLSFVVNPHGYSGVHFAAFPEGLVHPCILAGCPAGGTVLDPFSGSGTTGRVALSTGRNYVGIDLNEQYLPLAEARIRGDKAPDRDGAAESGSGVLDLFGDDS